MSKKIVGDLDFNLISKILNLPDPTNLQDPATKAYVDNLIQRERVLTRLTNASNTTLTNITDLSFAVIAGVAYTFEAFLIYQSNNLANGMTVSIAGPAGIYVLKVALINAGNSTAQDFEGVIQAVNGTVVSTSVPVINSNLIAKIEGMIIPSANGTIIPQFRSEVNTNQTSIEIGSSARLIIHP